MMNVLVTGGAGYIGSHTCLELLDAGYKVTVVDNLSNSSQASLERVQELTAKSLEFHAVDLLDKPALEDVFKTSKVDAVIHFAALKAVGESVAEPLNYYHNNVTGSLILTQVMREFGVKTLVFSSSATVYGDPESLPITEDAPCALSRITNPYGRSKFIIEEMLRDLHVSDESWNIALLRYFNPVGAHPSGRIGEDPKDIPNNLMPYLAQVAVGKRPKLNVYGNDYATPDGTGVRDYLHVLDLALGHIKALLVLQKDPGVVTYNLGTGRGYSVLELIAAFEQASGKKVPYVITSRRKGDIAASYAGVEKAKKELGWQAQRGLAEMCRDTWCWQSQNPEGYS